MAKRTLIIISVCFLSAVLLLYVLLNTIALNNGVDPAEVVRLRSKAQSLATSKSFLATDILNALDIPTSSVTRSEVDVCYADPNYAGFSVRSWRQKCYVRFVYGLNTRLSQAEVIQKIQANEQATLYFGPPLTYEYLNQAITRDCTIFDSTNNSHYSRVLYIPADYIPNRRDIWCTQPSLTNTDYLSGDSKPSIYEINKFHGDHIKQAQNQIWLINDENYYDRDIGCKFSPLCLQPPRITHPKL